MLPTQEGPSSISVPYWKQIAQFIKGVPNLEISLRDPDHAHFIIRTQGGSVHYVCT